MKHPIYDRILRRELGAEIKTRYSDIRGIYGDRKWVDDLDIVNELGGHSGCVNALCWSRSGQLLASGSDDLHVNIHTYMPESSASQFALTTSISTGHTQNIFSVKFMPYSNDRTIVTAAGDGEVRIFDIEYSGSTTVPSVAASVSIAGRRTGLNTVYNGVRYLSDGDTNAKVFRSHSDRVKRIVTESSPHYFLTCSEDGEVRQWDVRQPSSAYPPAPGRRVFRSLRPEASAEDKRPPPLISYKRYGLDLNTISCSPSQPHYIALGGAHLHCFLHDRRMLGRDHLAERGAPASFGNAHDEDLIAQATQCVRKFAPEGKKRMRRHESGHITACKISDANPNEMVVSWSGDWIYSFDLVRSPDADEETGGKEHAARASVNARVRESKARKRKRRKTGSSVDQEERTSSRQRTESSAASESRPEVSLRVQYQNGQSEEIPIEQESLSVVRKSVLTEPQRRSFRLAKSTVKLRKAMFTLGRRLENPPESDPTGYGASFTTAVGIAASILPEMGEIMRQWRYPVDPSNIDVAFQNTLRAHRQSAYRFVQAAGLLGRVLGGQLHTAGHGNSTTLADLFSTVHASPSDFSEIPQHEQFGYDFLKAITLWLDSGLGALVEGFSMRSDVGRRRNPRFPIPPESSIDAIDDILIPYLLRLASDEPIINVDASPFETDETRVTFATEKAAVLAFARALKLPFADLSSAIVLAPSSEGGASAPRIEAQDRRGALRFWALKVSRGLLMNAGKEVNFTFVDRAFGGLGRPDRATRVEERRLRSHLEEIDPDEEDEVVEEAMLVGRGADSLLERSIEETGHDSDGQTDEEEEGAVPPEDVLQTARGGEHAEEEDDADEDDDDEDDTDGDMADDDDNDDDEDEDEDEEDGPAFIYRSAFEQRRMKEKVEANVPTSSHTRKYRGHCNVRTVKDVNYYGLNDEYVVSGSDSGHLFIWDRKTTEIVNILEGDGEVVNVVQGHPYEPMVAVSGIDHSIKIFSADHNARTNARLGVGVTPHDPSGFSSLDWGRPRRRSRMASGATSEPAVERGSSAADEEDEEKVAPEGLSSRKRLHLEYQITSQNDVERRGGNREHFITRSMLHALAQRISQRQAELAAQGVGPESELGENDGPILVDGDCSVM